MLSPRATPPAPPDRPSHVHARILAALSKDIQAGRYAVGTRLPTQSDLCRQFNASRNSVREALRKLREAGLVSSRQGSGTLVERPARKGYVHSVDSVDELLQWSRQTEYRIERIALVRADPKLARRLNCSTGRVWLHLQGFRHARDARSALCWTETFVHHAYAGLRGRIMKQPGAIYRMIEQEFGETLQEVQQTARAVPIPPRQARVLGVAANSPGLEMERIYRTASGRVAEIAFSLHPGDRFSASITLRLAPQNQT
jgi:DNA-binding GntR family transcriptional regulator